jgi:hypothetical protein
LCAWQKVDEETLEMLREQKAFEDETVKRLTPLCNSLKNPLIRLFIHRIILDTMEHSDLYETLIDLNTRAVVGDIDKKIMTEELTTHVKEENKMLNNAIEISKSMKDENFKKILERIVEDERRHHQILQELLKVIEKEGKDWNRYLYDMFTGAGIP